MSKDDALFSKVTKHGGNLRVIKEFKRIRGRELFGGIRYDRNRARSVVAPVCRGFSTTVLQLFPASARLLRFKNRDAHAEGGEGGE